MLRRLHHADVVLAEQRHRAGEEIRRRHEVGVEDRRRSRAAARARRRAQRVVDVARLGVGVVGARDVAAAEALAQRLEPRPPAVVERPQPVVGIVHRQRADDRLLEDRLFLVVGADEHVDQRRRRQRGQPAACWRRPRRRGRARAVRKKNEIVAPTSAAVSTTMKSSATSVSSVKPNGGRVLSPAPQDVAPHQRQHDRDDDGARRRAVALEPRQNRRARRRRRAPPASSTRRALANERAHHSAGRRASKGSAWRAVEDHPAGAADVAVLTAGEPGNRDGDVIGAARQRRRLDGEIGRRRRGAGQADDGSGEVAAAVARLEVRRRADPQTVVDAFADRRGDQRAAAIEHAHQLLAAPDLLAGRGQHLPDAALGRRDDVGRRKARRSAPARRRHPATGGRCGGRFVERLLEIDDLLADVVGALRRGRAIVVAVADEHAAASGFELDVVHRDQALGGDLVLRRDVGVALGQVGLRPSSRRPGRSASWRASASRPRRSVRACAAAASAVSASRRASSWRMRASPNSRVCSVRSASRARALSSRAASRGRSSRACASWRDRSSTRLRSARLSTTRNSSVARRQRGARFRAGGAGLHFAFDRRAQGDDARVDDRLDAGGLRHALQRLVADRGDEREPEQRLDDAPRRRRSRLGFGRRGGRRRSTIGAGSASARCAAAIGRQRRGSHGRARRAGRAGERAAGRRPSGRRPPSRPARRRRPSRAAALRRADRPRSARAGAPSMRSSTRLGRAPATGRPQSRPRAGRRSKRNKHCRHDRPVRLNAKDPDLLPLR